MPKQLVSKAMQSPGWLLAICFALWFAAHSFFAFLLAVFTVVGLLKKSMKAGSSEAQNDESQASPASSRASAPTKHNVEQADFEYAKSAVVVPFKTGTDD